GRLHEHLVVEFFVILSALNRPVQEERASKAIGIGDGDILDRRYARVDDRAHPLGIEIDPVSVLGAIDRSSIWRQRFRSGVATPWRKRRKPVGIRQLPSLFG